MKINTPALVIAGIILATASYFAGTASRQTGEAAVAAKPEKRADREIRHGDPVPHPAEPATQVVVEGNLDDTHEVEAPNGVDIKWVKYTITYFSTDPFWAPQCPDCNKVWADGGLGDEQRHKLPIIRSDKCPFCQVETNWVDKTCPDCGGDGRYDQKFTNTYECHTCWGEGVVKKDWIQPRGSFH